MTSIVEKLFELQSLLLPERPADDASLMRVRQLRAALPASVLGHFDRRVARGKRVVSVVRHRVCGECHMRLPSGVTTELAVAETLVPCETCTCYLMLSPEDVAEYRRAREEARMRWSQNLHRSTAGV